MKPDHIFPMPQDGERLLLIVPSKDIQGHHAYQQPEEEPSDTEDDSD
jgi:hypothetical protein